MGPVNSALHRRDLEHENSDCSLPWPCKPHDRPHAYRPQHPVLLIPGIGGSVLKARNLKASDKVPPEHVWVRLVDADKEFRKKVWSRFNPETGVSETLARDIELFVPDGRFGLEAVDVLDPNIPFRVDDVFYFHDIIECLAAWGYEEGKTIFGFGYDFRQSNRLAQTLHALLDRIKQAHDAAGAKVDVITHSMGGLLVKCLVALHHEDVKKYVRKWVAITAPFRGAHGFAVDSLLTGVEFVSGWQERFFVQKSSLHQLVVQCPSVFELLAPASYPWQCGAPELRITRTGGSVDTFLPGEPVLRAIKRVLEEYQVPFDNELLHMALSDKMVETAVETQRLLAGASLPRHVQFYSISGAGLATPHHVEYGTPENPVKDFKDILTRQAVYSTVDGDGTVPLESAMGDGLHAVERVVIPGEHRAVLRSPALFGHLQRFLQVPDWVPATLARPDKVPRNKPVAAAAAAAPTVPSTVAAATVGAASTSNAAAPRGSVSVPSSVDVAAVPNAATATSDDAATATSTTTSTTWIAPCGGGALASPASTLAAISAAFVSSTPSPPGLTVVPVTPTALHGAVPPPAPTCAHACDISLLPVDNSGWVMVDVAPGYAQALRPALGSVEATQAMAAVQQTSPAAQQNGTGDSTGRTELAPSTEVTSDAAEFDTAAEREAEEGALTDPLAASTDGPEKGSAGIDTSHEIP